MSTKNPTVSIIIPVYKVEKYLKKCLDSIVVQTYQDFEAILIDDGSPDNCGKICDEYAQKYSNFKVIHQSNQGQAAARNHAAQIAEGEYIAFVDSDDFVEPDYIEYLLDLQRKYETDITIGGYKYLYEGKDIPERKTTELTEKMLGKEEALKRLNYTRGYGAFCWAKLFKKQLILNHPFPEGQIYEDLAVMYQIFGDSETIVYGNKVIYYWLQRNGSTMRSIFGDKQMVALAATKAQIEYMEEKHPEVLLSAKSRHEAKIVELMSIAIKSTESKDNYRKLKYESEYYHDVIRDKHVKKSQKIRMVAIHIGYLPTRLVFWLHEKMKENLI